MSTPPDQMAKQQLAQSHDIAHKAAAAHTAGLAKMMQALASLPAGAPSGDQGAGDQPLPNAPGAYDSMPDPSSWVLHDPQGAASYLDALAEAFAQLALNAGSAPQGAPMPTPMSSPGVASAGGAGY